MTDETLTALVTLGSKAIKDDQGNFYAVIKLGPFTRQEDAAYMASIIHDIVTAALDKNMFHGIDVERQQVQ
jgi:hypothetical protein